MNIEKAGICKSCGEMVSASLWRRVARNGATSFCRICPVCHKFAPFGGNVWIAKADIYKFYNQQQIESFPLLTSDAIAHCVVCGEKDVEEHHWAPRFKFKDECEKWPKDFLCRACHKIWHDAITPNVVWA